MKQNILKAMGRVVLPSLLLAALATNGVSAQEAKFDDDGLLMADRILPPDLLSGPNHTVQQFVSNDGYLNIYTIDSPFGQLKAVSTTQLRQYVHELNAVKQMELLSNSSEFKSGMKGKAGDVVTG